MIQLTFAIAEYGKRFKIKLGLAPVIRKLFVEVNKAHSIY